MKRVEFGYVSDWKSNSMAYWVHIEEGKSIWSKSKKFNPPAPIKDGVQGYRKLTIEFDGFIFEFTSEAQFEEFITVMSKKLLPTSFELANKRPGSKGPNSHWLSRLPGKTKPWRYREKLIQYCKKISFTPK